MPGGFSSGFSSGFGPPGGTTTGITPTINDLALRVLGKLGALDIGEGADSDTVGRIMPIVTNTVNELSAADIVTIESTSSIDPELIEPMAVICAFNALDDFGVNGDRRASITQQMQGTQDRSIIGAYDRIFMIVNSRPTYGVLATTFY